MAKSTRHTISWTDAPSREDSEAGGEWAFHDFILGA